MLPQLFARSDCLIGNRRNIADQSIDRAKQYSCRQTPLQHAHTIWMTICTYHTHIPHAHNGAAWIAGLCVHPAAQTEMARCAAGMTTVWQSFGKSHSCRAAVDFPVGHAASRATRPH